MLASSAFSGEVTATTCPFVLTALRTSANSWKSLRVVPRTSSRRCCLVASSGPDSQPDPLAWQYDLKTRRTFLKRCDYPSVVMAQLYKGSIITVYSRQLKIVEYADGFTERHFAKTTQFTVAMVMQEAVGDLGKIVDSVQREGFVITEMRLLRANGQMCVALQLTGEDAVAKWQVEASRG